MENGHIKYKDSTINFYRYGSGPKLCICFHGYGEEATGYDFFEKYAGDAFTFISIDLPYHGETDWKNGYDFKENDLVSIVELVIDKCYLHSGNPNLKSKIQNSKLVIMGFSLGGRMALGLTQAIPEKVERLVLLAPDGLKVNFWYWLSTQTWLGNRFFAFTMKHPGWFLGFLRLMGRLKLVNASILKFVNYYIGDKRVRQLLYDRWTTLRKIKPDLHQLKKMIRKNNITTRLVYGKHDRIILSSVGQRFCKGIESQSKLSVIHSGHQVLHEKHAEELLPALLQ